MDPNNFETSPAFEDESNILTDQDETAQDPTTNKDNMVYAVDAVENLMENEPDEFMRGEVDVAEQMDRTTREMALAAHGLPSLNEFDSPEETPGGLEEVGMKTDLEIAEKKATAH